MKTAAESIAYEAADRAFAASGSVVDLVKLESAERIYFAALKIEEDRAANLPADIAMQATENADETEGTATDRLYFLRMVNASAEGLR